MNVGFPAASVAQSQTTLKISVLVGTLVVIVTVPKVTSELSKAPFNTAFKVYTLLISSLVVV